MSHAAWAVLDIVPEVLVVVDEAARPVYLNAATRRIRSTPSVDTVGEALAIDPADAAALNEAVSAVLRGAEARRDIECRSRRGDEERWTAISVVPYRDDEARGALLSQRELMERTPAGRSLHDENTRLRRMIEATAEAVCLHRDGVIIDANPAMGRVFGHAAEELIGKRVDALLAAPSEQLAAHLAQAGDHTFEATALRKDGSTFVAEVLSTSLDDGAVHGLTLRDVTAHRRAEQAFRDSEERFRLISELSSEGLVLTEGGKIFHANTAMSKLFGYTREELIGMSPMQLTHKDDHRIAIDHIKSGSEEPYEARGLRKDGSTFIGSITGTNLPYQGRTVRGTRMRDITAQRQAEEMLRQNIIQEEKLRVQAERLSEMSTPFIPITDDIIAMPLIGTMDADRANQALETMLEGVARTRAHTAIVDITGVSGVDTGVASSLMRLAQAVRLQGSQVVLTGIRPEMAQTLARLDVNLTGVVVKGTFQDGIRYAMKRRRQADFDIDF